MFDGIINAINDFARLVLYGIASCFMFVLDIVWECIINIATLNISDFTSKWFLYIITAIVLFIVFRIIKIFIKTMMFEEYRMRLNITELIIRIILASMVVSLVPLAYSTACYMMSDAISHIEVFVPSESRTKDIVPSDIIKSSGRIDMNNIDGDLSQIIDNQNFDINMKDSNGNYTYFNSYASLFLLILESMASCIIFVMIGIQIASRLFSITYKYFLAPYSISGLIDHEDKSFGTWLKLIVGDLLMNFFQIYGIYLSLFLCNNSTILKSFGNNALGICTQIIFFLGSLSAVMNIPSVLATLIGGHSQGALQAMQESKSVASMAKTTGSAVAGATLGASMGFVGGMIAGGMKGNGLAANDGKMKTLAKTGLGALGGAVKGAGKTLKTNFTGNRAGGGVTKGASLLKQGIGVASNGMNSKKDSIANGINSSLGRGSSNSGISDGGSLAGSDTSSLETQDNVNGSKDTLLNNENTSLDNQNNMNSDFTSQKQLGLDDLMLKSYKTSSESLKENNYSSVMNKRLKK